MTQPSSTQSAPTNPPQSPRWPAHRSLGRLVRCLSLWLGRRRRVQHLAHALRRAADRADELSRAHDEVARQLEREAGELAHQRQQSVRLARRLEAALARIRIQQSEIEQLWAVVARDRQRVKAETARAARDIAEASQ